MAQIHFRELKGKTAVINDPYVVLNVLISRSALYYKTRGIFKFEMVEVGSL